MSFLFWKKTKSIDITFFARESFYYVNETKPLFSQKEKAPTWWKEIKSGWFDWNQMNPRSNIKQCLGFQETYNTGFLIRMWCDFALKVDTEKWDYSFSDNMSVLEHHSHEQHKNFYDNFHFFKFNNPWILHCSEKNLKFAVLNPTLFFDSPLQYSILQGIFPLINNIASLNFFISVSKPKQNEQHQIIIKYKTPVMHVIPLTDRNINYKIKFLDDREFKKTRDRCTVPLKFIARGRYNYSKKNEII